MNQVLTREKVMRMKTENSNEEETVNLEEVDHWIDA